MADQDSSRGIGIDVGGTKILGVVADAAGRVQHRIATSTPPGSDRVRAAIADVAEGLIERVHGELGAAGAGLSLRGVGVGVPGLVDRSGILRYGPNLPGVVGLDVGRELRERSNLPVIVENDASLAAVAEHRAGAASGHDHALVITQGTGIGGGIIVDGSLLRGANGFAGEAGTHRDRSQRPALRLRYPGLLGGVRVGNRAGQPRPRPHRRGWGERRSSSGAGGDPDLINGEHVASAPRRRRPRCDRPPRRVRPVGRRRTGRAHRRLRSEHRGCSAVASPP